MREPATRLHHCHKSGHHHRIYEEYEVIDGRRTLVSSSCPQCRPGATGYKCNGMNEDNTAPCAYNSYRR